MKEKWNKVGLLVLVVAALLWVGALDAGEVVCADGACGEEAQAEGFDASTAEDRFGQAHEDGVEGSAPPLDSAFPVPLSSTRSVAVTLPVISPCTITVPARSVPLMRPRSPTMRVPLDSISPRSRPLNITVPAHT